ncbi:MAG: DUF169 domain-containing protein [Promethearchaeota archaeon]
MITNKDLVNKFSEIFKLRYPPIAFFYTENPPKEVYNPKKLSMENIPCIIQFLNGVKSGETLVLGKKSRNLCPGGLSYLGFRKPITGIEAFLSKGIFDKDGKLIREGERFTKTPELAKELMNDIPFKPAPSDYAVFMPLDQLGDDNDSALLVIFFVNVDQLTGLIQLSNYDTTNKARLGLGSDCQTIIREPLIELDKDEAPRAVVGMLSDITGRRFIKTDEATFTVSYKKLKEMYHNIDESFLSLNPWKLLQRRLSEK